MLFRRRLSYGQDGNVLLGALGVIVVLSVVAGNVLLSSTTRYNVTSSQLRSWKDALTAAETGGDVAYAEVRKTILDPTNAFAGWTTSGGVKISPNLTFGRDNHVTSSRVDAFYTDPITGNDWYRIRVRGTTPVKGLKRTGMDSRLSENTKGDSLLRKIDFNYDHFIATYGPAGDGTGKQIVPVAFPQITRRVELIVAPVTPFEAAIKASGSFYGLGSAAQIDSFNSANGPYQFVANNPGHPLFPDSRSGHVQIGTGVATVMGWIYGNLATNGGTVRRTEYVSGTIDNNVPFTLPPYKMPSMPLPQPSPTNITGNVTINPPGAATAANPTYYVVSSLRGDLTINAFGSNTPTHVAIRVTGDITGKVRVKPEVRAKIFFDGNVDLKTRDIVNESGIPARLQFYGISPTAAGVTQTISLTPPGNFAATFYAPTADFSMNGNPDITGAMVCRSFYGNGNTSWHYDRALDSEGEAVDYRIISYVEDTR